MSQHPEIVEGWQGTLEELILAIGNMRYDIQATFLQMYASEITRQGLSDGVAGRRQLAARLHQIAGDIEAAQVGMQAAWTICEPHMKDACEPSTEDDTVSE